MESESHGGLGFSDLFDLLRIGLTLTGIEDGRLRRINEFACQMLGREAADLVGKEWHDIVDPSQIDELETIDQTDVMEGRLDRRQRTVRFVRPDGTITHVLASGTKVTVDGYPCFLSQLEDITELVATHRQLQLVLENTPVSVFLIGHDGQVLTSGGAAHQLPAAELRKVVGSSVFTAFRDYPDVLEALRRSLRGERVHEVLAAGDRWYDVHLVPLPSIARQPPSVAGVASDVTERERATTELRARTSRQTALADLAQHALEIAAEEALWDRGIQTLTDQLGAEVVITRGRSTETPTASKTTAADECADPDEYTPTPADAAGEGAATPARTALRIPVGPADEPLATICLRAARHRLTDDDASFVRSVSAVLASAALRIRMEEEARFRSLHDSLTGLPNRVALLDALERSLSRSPRGHLRTGVLFIDLDGFKKVNDTLGHQAGDELLAEVGRRLRQAVRPGDVAGRLAGDEFAVLCEDVASMDDLRRIGDRVLHALEPAVDLPSPVRVSASVGLALSEPGLIDAEKLLTAADVAMYEAKRQGRGRVVGYDEPLRAAHAAGLPSTACAISGQPAESLDTRAPYSSHSGRTG